MTRLTSQSDLPTISPLPISLPLPWLESQSPQVLKSRYGTQANNVVTTAPSDITLSINTNPSAGTLSGTLPITPAAGVSTFSNISIDKSGIGYTLDAAYPGLPNEESVAFNILGGTATQLSFIVQPSNAVSTVGISPDIVVHAFDVGGNLATGFTGNITLAINNNPGTGTLSGTAVVTAVTGVGYTYRSLN